MAQFIDIMADFWQFWGEVEGQGDTEKVAHFQSTVVAPHATVFEAVRRFKDLMNENYLLGYFRDLAPLTDAMHTLDSQLRHNWSSDWGKFTVLFPDMAWAGTVYVMPSLFCFDGRVQEVAGETALLLGVDMMAKLGQTNLAPFLHHEWTHLYHNQIIPDAAEERLFWALWREGVAVYFSRLLNPHADFKELLLSPELVLQTEEKLPKIAAELLEKLDSTGEQDYADFFFGRLERTDIPARSGYYVGLRVVTHLAERYSPAELIRLTGNPLRKEIGAVLKTLTYKIGHC